MKGLLVLCYGLIAYLFGSLSLVAFILFIGDWPIFSYSINDEPRASLTSALITNTIILLLFGLQHSVMARPWFKNWLTRFIPDGAERPTYVLLSGIAMILFPLYWQPIAGTVWQIDNTLVSQLLFAGYVIGWTMTFYATFVIDHFELFGLQQAFYYFKKQTPPENPFIEKSLYKIVRHPIQLGVLIGIWSTAIMSYGHFMLAAGMTIYIFIGLYFEERDLIDKLGEQYLDYKKRVYKVIPPFK